MMADLMGLVARTAPKTKGQDFVILKVVRPGEAKKLGEDMIAYGQKTRKTGFDRDGANVKASAVKMAARLN